MIPEFPQFKNLQLSDKEEIEKIASKFPPYSAFNFTNLWAWDVRGDRKLSKLNGNLVVLFTNYNTQEPYLSFLGINKCEDTTFKLLNFAEESKIFPKLCFITKETIQHLQSSSLHIEEDCDNSDYIFSPSRLAELCGSELKDQRHLARRFRRENPDAVFSFENLSDPSIQEKIHSVLRQWENRKKSQNKPFDLRFEEKALRRLLETADTHKLTLSCVHLHDAMLGFSIDEILPSQNVIAHFIKADNFYRGIYEFINKELAQHLVNCSATSWNWQQDLNIENLRKTKISYRPIALLKRYTVSLSPAVNKKNITIKKRLLFWQK